MHQLRIETITHIINPESYIINCYLEAGSILPNETWYLDQNPQFKIYIKSPLFIKKEHYNGIMHFYIEKPNFDINLIHKNSIWYKLNIN